MKHFKYIFLTLFLVGCGVMGSPEEKDSSTAKNGEESSTSVNDQYDPKFSSVVFFPRILFKEVSDLNNSLLTYRIIKDNDSLNTLVSDLNLLSEDNQTLSSLDLNSSYILYYPIKRSSDCGFSDSVVTEQNITKITIKENLKDCKTAVTYYLPFYRIDNNVTNIEVDAFGEKETLSLR